MSEVVSSVGRITQIVQDFHRATQQQSNGIDQVSRAVAEMEKSARQNHSLVESMSRASDELRVKGKRLTDAVEVFEIEPTTRCTTASPDNPPAHADTEPARLRLAGYAL